MENILLSTVSSFFLTYLMIPSLIRLAEEKNLYDEPKERGSHSTRVPTLGGLAFFVCIIFSLIFWSDFQNSSTLQYFMAAMFIVTYIGLKDDLLGVSPLKKLLGQMIAALIVVVLGKVRISSFYGILGIGELPGIVSIIFTVFTILVIINSFNLIDGINGLAASIAIVSALTFGIFFFITNINPDLSLLALTLTGSLLAFLKYNLCPSKIFMGDTGSLILGLFTSVLAIKFIEISSLPNNFITIKSGPALAMSIIAYPLFDLLRSFSIRIKNGKSPFTADKNHIHHLLLATGLSHEVSTLTIVLFNTLIIAQAVLLDNLGNYIVIGSTAVLCLIFVFILKQIIKSKASKNKINN